MLWVWVITGQARSFLSAATLIGQAQPDDAAPITRRAIEVIRLAAAVKADASVAKEWVAYEKRMERWKARDEGKKPKHFHVQIPVEHELVEQLMVTWGIISDADVHFTPEYFHSLRWERRGDSRFLQYFSGEQRTIESAIIELVGAHMMMLQVLNDCLDSAFGANAEWRKLRDEIYAAGKPYADKMERTADSDEPASES